MTSYLPEDIVFQLFDRGRGGLAFSNLVPEIFSFLISFGPTKISLEEE